MNRKAETLKEWNEPFNHYEIITTDNMPDIDLYMDQVITFVTKQLGAVSDEPEKIITPSMINNYTKNGIIPRPVNKKYNKTHLTSILMMCIFKQILPINDITIFIDKAQEENISRQYELFSQMQNEQVRQIAARFDEELSRAEEDETDLELLKMAMEMIIEANMLSVYAKKILHTLKEPEKSKKQSERQANHS